MCLTVDAKVVSCLSMQSMPPVVYTALGPCHDATMPRGRDVCIARPVVLSQICSCSAFGHPAEFSLSDATRPLF